jgi:glycine/D-amino acid oxidase-like deaminating enzyme/nitrite reductase/ring-hydroxylating ferredoxin subunit
MNLSLWEATGNPSHNYPVLTSDLNTDIVIVGGGITGLTCALQLAEAGKNVIVLEAMKIGLGTTGNSTGNLYASVDDHLCELKKKWDVDVVKKVVQSRIAAINKIEEIVNRFQINCDFTRTGFHHFLENPSDKLEQFLEKEYEIMQECGLNPVLDIDASLPFEVKKVLTIPGQAQFHPLNYVRGLAQNLPRNCQVFENSPVVDYDEEKGTVSTARFTVKASAIVLATHVPKGVFAVQTVLGPYREFGVAARLASGEMPAGIYWGIEQPKHSVRRVLHGNNNYVMVIGDKFKTGHPENTFEYVDKLEKYLHERFDVSEITHIWGGQQYKPADGLPYMGRHSDRLYYMTGFSTDGLVYGTLGALIVSDEILNRPNPWTGLYMADRHTPLKSAKDFIKENADNLVTYIKDIPWKVDAKKLEEIKPGEGKIIQEDGEKLAVYRDLDGNLEVVSAVCTHMKCIVNWNTGEKTWDCPCHGSRFKTNGEVIEGPAITALKKKQVEQ